MLLTASFVAKLVVFFMECQYTYANDAPKSIIFCCMSTIFCDLRCLPSRMYQNLGDEGCSSFATRMKM